MTLIDSRRFSKQEIFLYLETGEERAITQQSTQRPGCIPSFGQLAHLTNAWTTAAPAVAAFAAVAFTEDIG